MSRTACLGLALLILPASLVQAHPHRYSNSGYGYPAHSQPAGYAPPGYAPQGFAQQPGYDQPSGFGQPGGYGQPSYGQPAPQAYGRRNFAPQQGGYRAPASAYRLQQDSLNGGGRLNPQGDMQPSLSNGQFQGPPQGMPPGGYVGAPAGYGSFGPPAGGRSCGPGCNHDHGH